MTSPSCARGFLRPPAILLTLAAGFLAGCGDGGSVLSPGGDASDAEPKPAGPRAIDPDYARSDGATGGAEGVWFLPPLAPNPNGNPAFDRDAFNPNLPVDVEIYACPGDDSTCPADPPAGAPDAGGPAPLTDGDHYQFDWKTPKDGEGVFRAFVLVGNTVLGFLDIELGKGGGKGKAKKKGGDAGEDGDGENAVTSPGSNAPIRVMIENLALGGCEDDEDVCVGVVTGEPSEDVLLELETETNDGDTDNDLTLHIPEGTSFEDEDGNPVPVVVFTLSRCAEELDTDLRTVGQCFTIDTDPPNITLVGGEATVSICELHDLDPGLAGLTDAQADRVTIHQYDNGSFAEALPHAPAFACETSSAALPSHPLMRLARAVQRGLWRWVAPEPLVAGTALLDTGGGGSLVNFRSSFQGAIPSRIELGPGGDLGLLTADVGAPVDPAPIARVVDAGGDPVPGAFVRFQVLGAATSATVDDPDDAAPPGDFVRIPTDVDGIADATWVLNDTDNPHRLRAFSVGMVVGTNADVLMPGGWPGDPQSARDLGCTDTDPASVADGCLDGWVVAEGLVFEAAGLDGCGPNENECVEAVSSGSTESSTLTLETDDDQDPINDFTVHLPAGTQFEDENGDPVDEVVFSLEPCQAGSEFDTDLKAVGSCFSINTLPPNVSIANGTATVSICELEGIADGGTDPTFASHAQEERVTIHQFDNGVFAEALPHEAPVGCPTISMGPSSRLGRLAGAVRERVLGWLLPDAILASSGSSVLDTGGGGSLANFRSNYQAALPSMLVVPADFPPDGNGEPEPVFASLGGETDPAPVVKVVDAGDEPVEGATVRFELLDPAGSSISAGQVTTGSDGLATVDWTLETLDNPHELRVFAKGMTRGLDEAGDGALNVLQPELSPIFIGGVDDGAGDAPGDDFCATEECAGSPPWIVAESILFQGSVLFEAAFETAAGQDAWTTGGLWNRSMLGDAGLTNTAEDAPFSYVTLAPDDASGGDLPAPAEGDWAFWYGDHVDPAPELGNYMGSAAAGQAAGSGGRSVLANTGDLVSPTFTVPPAAPDGEKFVLRFAAWFEIESADAPTFDLMDVFVEEVGGGASSVSGRLNPAVDANGTPPQPFTSGGFNTAPVWFEPALDLTGLEGKTVQIRFAFDTGDTNFNGFRGWIVDDVRVVLEPEIPVAAAVSALGAQGEGTAGAQAGGRGLRPVVPVSGERDEPPQQ